MEAAGKDCEDETLQTAFKKLRVDAESVPGAPSGPDAPRTSSRSGLEAGGVKAKLSGPKDAWHHGCMRKASRGASRSQRRRRSKSPILTPPKFTYCSAAPPAVSLKQQRLAVPDPTEPRLSAAAGVPPPSPAATTHSELPSPPVVFGAAVSSPLSSSTREMAVATASSGESEEGEKKSVAGGAESTDFRALSQQLDGPRPPCCSSCDGAGGAEPGCGCRSWNGVEVYSFTGLRHVISECERGLPGGARTLGRSHASPPPPPASTSPRSCSEQARAYVDDITIEDLSGYMEYYLYFPKKMSHMAEMMYT